MINELINTELQEIEGKEYEGFRVENIDQANWCFRKIRALKEKAENIKKLATQERERIDNWEQSENKGTENSMQYFEGLLNAYFITLRKSDPKAKVSTPYGKISSRKSTKWNYIDEKMLIDYLKENKQELIKTKEEINKAELKKIYTNGIDGETGEILPGVQIFKEETISIKVD